MQENLVRRYPITTGIGAGIGGVVLRHRLEGGMEQVPLGTGGAHCGTPLPSRGTGDSNSGTYRLTSNRATRAEMSGTEVDDEGSAFEDCATNNPQPIKQWK